ncbi:hypothetical protein [Agriterribacter sp.]|uniref:hypothetical protein n=1 Tax=Agriterribacter sp. TaxID=2821509 RepID=UPI002B95BB0F|nr:hypothetical protein [Agriterribacter sp.]HTN06791.1 hypothetical protein [Agriterribacter sp.]
MNKYKLTFFFLFILLQAHAQNAANDSLQQQFNRYTQNAFSEKVYVHTDRNFYITGEIMWFKAYVTDGMVNYPSNISKLAYADVIDRNNKIFLQTKIEIKNGNGNGSLYLPVNMPSGNYKIRSYTNWMKNAGAAFYFEKAFTVVNAQSTAGLITADTTAQYDIQFFPEGGNLVKKVESKVAFRMTDRNGRGVPAFTGVVVNETHDTIALFRPSRFGIGYFNFIPTDTHLYKAYISTPSGGTIVKNLPAASEEGYVMKLRKAGRGEVEVIVYSPGTGNTTPAVQLFVHTRGSVKNIQTKMIQNGSAHFMIAEDILGDGISHFTIFNSLRQPVCERLYFKTPSKHLLINAKANKPGYGRREKVTVSINSTDTDNISVPANMSLAVYRLDSLQTSGQTDIFSYLWLSADLKGTVESPSWYFSGADGTAEAMDNLMLTHGWRKFEWADIQQNRLPSHTFLPEYTGHIITGKITDSATRKPLPSVTVYLSVPGDRTQCYASTSDAGGNIRFYTREVYGPGEVILQPEVSFVSGYTIEINTPFQDQFSAKPLAALQLSAELKNAIEQNSVNAQAQRKFLADQLKIYHLPQTDSLPFYGKPDEKYLLDDYTRFTTMEEVLREYVSGVLVGRSKGKFHLNIFDMANNRLFKENPLVLLDGVPVQDMDRIMRYDPLKIRKLELVKRRYYYGPLVVDGILNFTTHKSNLPEFETDDRTVILDYEGMQWQRAFYSPLYETKEQAAGRLPDFRNLLYWSPDVITGKDGRAVLTFFTGDVKGKYTGIIEGMSADGKAGSGTFSFEVKDNAQ